MARLPHVAMEHHWRRPPREALGDVTPGEHRVERCGRAFQRGADADLALVRSADTFFVATVGPEGAADASHRGGTPGFVVADAGAISFPDYAGTAMYMTLGNLHARPAAGLLFADWETGTTLQVSGRAAIDWSAERAAAFPGAERMVDVAVERVVATEHTLAQRWRLVEPSRFNPPAR